MPLRAPSLSACPSNPDPADPDAIPTITVDRPTDGALVTSPLRITGRADTFEANVQARLWWTASRSPSPSAPPRRPTSSPLHPHLPFETDTPSEGCREVFTDNVRDGSQILVVQRPLILDG